MNLCRLIAIAYIGCCLIHHPFVKAETDVPPVPEQEKQPEWLTEAANTLPHSRQVNWQDMGLTCFVHFGVNTFTDREWGNGFEDPGVFQPSQLDCEQWVLAAKAAGMKMVLLTGKHHDGFCLWQTRYTKHSVASSPWKDGKGDVLRELTTACAKHDMKVGIYLSPADLYQIENKDGLYGNLSKKTTRTIPEAVAGRPFAEGHRTFTFDEIDDYNAYMLNQLYEVLTEYGPMHEVWFDGAHPKRKGGQTYRYDAWYHMIRELAPEAVIAIKGPDVRWVGNEGGHGRANEYSVVPIAGAGGEQWRDRTGRDLGSRSILKAAYDAGATFHWYPAELDTSIRGGWFYHSREDGHPKGSLDRLLNCYFDGPGNNSVFLLNVPPDRRGLFHESDVASLKEFGDYLRMTFDEDLASGASVQVSSSAEERGSEHLVDGDAATYWQLAEGDNRGWIQLDLGLPKTFDVVDLQEHILSSGQRIEAFRVEVLDDDSWQTIAESGTVGHRKSLRIDQVTAQYVRIHITSGRSNASLRSIGLFKRPLNLRQPEIQRDQNGQVTISAPAGTTIFYTLDGTTPSVASKYYDQPFPFAEKGVLSAIAVDNSDAENVSDVVTQRYDVAPAKWSIFQFSSEQADANEQASNAIDGDPTTIWHSRWRPDKPAHPHSITIDFGETLSLAGFSYLPRKEDHKEGCILRYRIEVSSHGDSWQQASSSEFENMVNNPTYREVKFEKTHKVRYMRLTSLSSIRSSNHASAAEIGVITE